jgi:DnaJ-domain-containing protein 1
VSITRRLIDLARSNLNALLDKAGDVAHDDRSVDDFSDEELEAELRRRRDSREREARADEARKASGPNARAERGRGAGAGGAAGSRENKIAQFYAQLEVPYGSSLETVKQSYRRLMRKYHPDLHSGDPGKQKIATELSQALTRAYQELEQALKAKGAP